MEVIKISQINVSSEAKAAMPAQWTADLLGRMHLSGVTARQLATEAGWDYRYLSAVINGHRTPKGAESKLNAALDRLIERMEDK